MKRTFWIMLVLVSMLAACAPKHIEATPTPIVTSTPTPLSRVELVEDNDGKREIKTIGHADGFEDVMLERNFAEAQFLCHTMSISFTVGNASARNADTLTLDKCPALLAGVELQVVNTQTAYSFDCSNCTIEFDGQWEIGKGVRVWRGTIRITPIDDQEEFYLVLVPLQQP